MRRSSGGIFLVCIGLMAGACRDGHDAPNKTMLTSSPNEDLYSLYRDGVIPKNHHRVYLWSFVDEVIKLKASCDAQGGLNWNDLKTEGLIQRKIPMFVAPGFVDNRVFLGLILVRPHNGMQEVELVDLDGQAAVVSIQNRVVSDLMAVVIMVAHGLFQSDDLSYPEEKKDSLFAFWFAIKDVEWEPLENRYREWTKKPAFERFKR